MSDAYIVLTNKNSKVGFYVHADLSAHFNGCFVEDFTSLFEFLAARGWQKLSERMIPVPDRETETIFPIAPISRRQEYKHEFSQYLFGENSCNLEIV